MSLISSSLYFTYDGIDSTDMKLMNINFSSGLMEENFSGGREINEITIKGRDKPYFQDINRSPLVLDVNFGFTDTWDEELIKDVKSWLCQNYYKPLIFSDNPDEIYYALLVSDSKLLHNGLRQGYCNLQFRCDSPFKYSPYYMSQFDLSSNVPGGTEVSINNLGNIICIPTIEITKIGDGNNEADFSITNLSNSGEVFKFTTAKKACGSLLFSNGVKNGDTVTIGRDVFEFDTDNSITGGNIRIDISTGQTKTQATAVLSLINSVADGETITIGSNTFEIDTNGSVAAGHTPVNVASYAVAASGILSFTGIPVNGEILSIGNDVYEFDTDNSVMAGNIQVNISGLTSVDSVINQLTTIINSNKTEKITAAGNTANDTVTITSTIPGAIGNDISLYETVSLASWGHDTLTGGIDCSAANAIVPIQNAINNTIGANFQTSHTGNTITINALSTGIYSGSAGNAAATSTTSSGITFGATTFTGGYDCTPAQAAAAINAKINLSVVEPISSANPSGGQIIVVTYDNPGIAGHIPTTTTCANASWEHSTLVSGDGIENNEIITVDNERKSIVSSLPNTYRYSVFNDNYLVLVPGVNRLLIKGNARVKFEYEFRFI